MEKRISKFNVASDDDIINIAEPRDETIVWQIVKPIIAGFPMENEELLPGIKWGSHSQLYTPAFWKLQYLLTGFSTSMDLHRLSSTLIEEIVMCILGGYGIPSEVGIIAFNRLKENDIIYRNVSFDKIYQALAQPFQLSNGKQIQYRFYNQKSKYLHMFLSRHDLDAIPQHDDLALRSWLLSITGIGLKTASWITRNWLKSSKVAILDIHLLRAGKLTGFFQDDAITNYLHLEKQYLAFCEALDVDAANMDAIIWRYMKNNSKLAVKTLYS